MESEDRTGPLRRVRLGPGLLVTAAFIGPGTVVTASKAGAEFGCELLWTIVFACVGTIVLQSLAARVGITGRAGLGEAIRRSFSGSRVLLPVVVLVIAAIGIGNAAYQTGNLTGAVTGITSVAGGSPAVWLAILVTTTCVILLIGRYRILHVLLVGIVVLLSVSFLCTAMFSLPSIDRVIQGALVPRVGEGSLTLVLGLIGTTIVPYNLFLHASAAASTWKDDNPRQAIVQSDWDTVLSVSLGGLVTASILVTASTAFFDTETPWTSIDQIADQLDPTLGRASGVAFAFGLFAAGLTSSITAPMATAYAVCGCLGWPATPANARFKAIALAVLAVGGCFAFAFGKSPSVAILFAQVANGLLLPVIAVFLLVVVQRNAPPGAARLGVIRLSLARLIVLGVASLGVWRIISVFT